MSDDKQNPDFEVTVISRLQHGALRQAVKEYGGIKPLAEELGVMPSTLSSWLNLKYFLRPGGKGSGRSRYKSGKTKREVLLRLCEITKKRPEELFPQWLEQKGLLKEKKVREVTRTIKYESLEDLRGEQKLIVAPERSDPAEQQELACRLKSVLKTLPPRSRRVIELRYGLHDGYEYNLEEVGQILKLSRERVRQIEAKAMQKLRHPTRTTELKELLD